MPTNLYGPNDNFDLISGHVLPAMIRRFHDAREEGRDEVVVWGTGAPGGSSLHVDDLADACVFLMQRYGEAGHINVGGECIDSGTGRDGAAHRASRRQNRVGRHESLTARRENSST